MDLLGPDTVEVIIVDDGSSDDTGRIAAQVYRELPNHYVVRHELNRGKGAAVRLGVSAARGDNVVVCDADMAIRPAYLPAMLRALDVAPIAAGSRAVDGVIRYDSWLRTKSGAAFNTLVRRYVTTSLRDTQCGFKGLRLGAARLISAFALVDGFAYDVEMLYLARRLGLDVTTVDVQWDDVAGSSVSVMGDSRRMLHDIRSLRRTSYECPSVTVDRNVEAAEVREISRQTRQSGLVIAHGLNDAIIALPRDGALAGIEIAQRLHGTFSVQNPEQFASRTLTAI